MVKMNISEDIFEELDNAIFADVLNNPLKYIKIIFGSWHIETPYNITDSNGYKLRLLLKQTYKIKAEEEFFGKFDKTLPDIIIEVTAYYAHKLEMKCNTINGGVECELVCSTCGYRPWKSELLIPSDKISTVTEKSLEENNKVILNMAWEKAEKYGYKIVNDQDGFVHIEMGDYDKVCFEWKYYAFIDIRSHIKLLRETLRQLKSNDLVGKRNTYEDSNLFEITYSYGHSTTFKEVIQNKNFTLKGTFLITPDLRFKNIIESQGIGIIPFDVDTVRNSLPEISFNEIKEYYKENEKGKE